MWSIDDLTYSLSHLEQIRAHHLRFTATEKHECTVNCNHWSQREFSVYLSSNNTLSKAEALAVGLGIHQEERNMEHWSGHGEGATALGEQLKSACPIFISRGIWQLFLIWLEGLGQVVLCSDLGMLHQSNWAYTLRRELNFWIIKKRFRIRSKLCHCQQD